ncbi:hypothetical protein ASPACDRAFT_47308 [Aspergillus aculeatus ATCC 16872]|uniref:Ubiquinol-cytochrome-c reductase cytochrome c1 n=1 Tax=Aspergillus aculeatus (strain ATCC 16872 / CBS 172.66 / WB 5094) TaxID=690307 RepID=A0A1L9WIE2_ASPA1|nr:uncharacterized protein ASPACDRAFT_47308 [Aspergillus aculeatus ATCC 16872]OJJ95951.1 hypothetical protein ASPACDRAFT_47308 [Aspergillus aculeatus ATCC 16872]
MDTVPVSEQRKIFLACKAIFSGSNANLRKKKLVQAQLQSHKSSLQKLIPNYTLERTLPVVRSFLENGLFQSESKAQRQFPGLLEPCVVQKTQHAALEQQASRSNERALQEVAKTYEAEQKHAEEEVVAPEPPLAPTAMVTEKAAVAQQTLGRDSDHTPSSDQPPTSLFPLYLPYHAQHQVLTTVQQVLEDGIFEFCQQWLPDELISRGWDCAAAVELSKWTRLLGRWSSQLPEGTLRPTDLPLETILAAVVKIRHTAVHRLPTTAQGVCDLVAVAGKLAATLGDTLRGAQLDDLHRDLQEKIQILESNLSLLEATLACQLDGIQAERDRLDREEQALRAKTIQDDGENKRMVGLLVERAIDQIFTVSMVEPGAAGLDRGDVEYWRYVGWLRGLFHCSSAPKHSGLGLMIMGAISCFLVLAWVAWRGVL